MFDFREGSLTNVVEYKGNYYYIDSCFTADHGYETMVFPCDEKGNVTDWGELYCEIYDTQTEMEVGHKAIVANLSDILAA